MAEVTTEVRPGVRRLLDGAHGLLIGGSTDASESGRTFETLDPATGGVLALVAEGGEADVARAVASARRAFEGPWSRLSAADRSLALLRLADRVEQEADDLAQLECLDNGKPQHFARMDVDFAVSVLRYYAGWPTKLHGEIVPVATPGLQCQTRLDPVGVCALIVPWNFPLLMAVAKVAPALAAGCTMVLKPAPETPLTALRLGELGLEAGLPEGVLNVVPGGPETGIALVEHPGIDKIAFTGSTAVGREIGASAGRALTRVTLELGGKSPNVILPDADLEAALPTAFSALYFNSGQVCTAGSRLYAPADRFDDVVEGLEAAARSAVMGPGLSPGTFLGPLVSGRQRARVLAHVEQGVAEGAELVTGGAAPDRDGFFVEPTLFTATSDDLTIVREEIFGPVLVVLPYTAVDEAIERANATEYGLAAGVFTRDQRLAHEFATRVRAGIVFVNTWGAIDPAAPFGGFKASGLGREYGRVGLDAYLEHKTVWTQV